MPRKGDNPKRAKLTEIERFFKDMQGEQTSITVSDKQSHQPSFVANLLGTLERHVVQPSESDSASSSTSVMAGSHQSSAIGADRSDILTLVENDQQGSSSMTECSVDISLPSPHSGEFPASEASGSSGLHGYSSSSVTTLPSSTSSATSASNLSPSLDKPNQPDVSVIPAQQQSSRTLYFPKKWYQDYQWLHYSPDLKKVLCFYCSKASGMGLTDLA